MSQPPWTVRDAGFPTIPPDRYLEFFCPAGFARAWAGMGLGDDVMVRLEVAVMSAPAAAPVIPGTRGIRKMRFVPPGWETGRSGAARVWYAYFPRYRCVLLVVAYPKTRTEDLTVAKKKLLAGLVGRFENWLGGRAAEAGKPRAWHRRPGHRPESREGNSE
jgi:hypothetical protein